MRLVCKQCPDIAEFTMEQSLGRVETVSHAPVLVAN